MFEPHQPELCGFVPDVLLDITAVWDQKRKAMESMEAQGHLVDYYADLGRRRGTQAVRNSGQKEHPLRRSLPASVPAGHRRPDVKPTIVQEHSPRGRGTRQAAR